MSNHMMYNKNSNNSNPIEIKRKDGQIEYMTKEEFTRWACLIEGIQAVDEKLVAANVPDTNTKWVKPLAFEKYIQERFPAMLHDVTIEHRMGNI
jgi:hypothetical protein|tara:strand:+ start:1940 stop:2221 length:282 start_codon:yes stop_codon:yes gene_type:complete